MDQALLQWLNANGFELHQHVELRNTPAQGRHIVAKDAIAKDTVLFRIPHSKVLSAYTTDISHEIRAAKLSSWNALAIAVLRELTRGTDSPWHAYLSVLPSVFTLPVFWPLTQGKRAAPKGKKSGKTQDKGDAPDSWIALSALPDLNFSGVEAEFFGTHTIERALAMRTEWQSQYDSVVKPFLKAQPAAIAPAWATFEAYARVIAIISSYSFTDADGAHVAAEARSSHSTGVVDAPKDDEQEEEEDDEEEEEEDDEVPLRFRL